MKTEPVLTAWIATVLVGLAARFGLRLDAEVALAVAGLLGTVAAVVARHFVTPTTPPASAVPPRR